jgi:hypothetical protein
MQKVGQKEPYKLCVSAGFESILDENNKSRELT